MPRRPRDDLEPIVQIPRHPLQATARQRFGNELGNDDEIIIKKKWRPSNDEDRYFILNDSVLESYRRIAAAKNLSGTNKTTFSYEIFIRLWEHVGQSTIRLIEAESSTYRMTSVGCRVVHSGIAQLAKDLGISVSTLGKQIALYRDIGLIVNEAKALPNRSGFIEFDVMVGWRGKLEHRTAYAALPTGMRVAYR